MVTSNLVLFCTVVNGWTYWFCCRICRFWGCSQIMDWYEILYRPCFSENSMTESWAASSTSFSTHTETAQWRAMFLSRPQVPSNIVEIDRRKGPVCMTCNYVICSLFSVAFQLPCSFTLRFIPSVFRFWFMLPLGLFHGCTRMTFLIAVLVLG